MRKLTLSLDAWFERWPRVALGLSLAMIALLGEFQRSAGTEYNIDFLYVVPVALAARHHGRRTGIVLSVLAAAMWFAADYWTLYPERDWLGGLSVAPMTFSLINAALGLIIFLAVALLVSRLRADALHQRAIARTKGEMLSTVSHEFNNALTTMGMTMFHLEDIMGDKPAAEVVELYEVLDRNITRLKRTVENLLNQARMESGRFALDVRRVDAVELARSVLTLLKPAAKQKKLDLVLDLPAQPVFVKADRDALQLALTNLVSNAVKYTPAEGRVAVTLRTAGEPPLIAVMEVADTGIGMDPAEQEEALEGFARSSRGKKMATGFGLGLKLAREMLASHGARLNIRSAPGKGSRLSFSLPVAQSE